MRHYARRSLTGAFVLLTVGTAFLLRNLGIIDPRTFEMWWPLLLIAAGVAKLVASRGQWPPRKPYTDFGPA
jgi:hypothetical protein